ncbi:MAG TPA: tRNA-dihydrouridine synthase [Candidatus Bathyarchaeia archaeon]|nr:tRNA-dihydrouridine synthase [Candidatus Bathyarchaeia archaeon]
MPLRIGGVAIDFPVGLGALAGYSDLPYRLVCRSLGAPYCITEAMLDRQVLLEGKLRKRLVRLDPTDHPVAGQIMGVEPETMADAARALDRMGFDIIDLNFACPVRKVVSHKRGGALMKDPGRALATVRAVVEAVPGRPVTLKLRRSFKTDDRTQDDFWTIARGAFEAGAAGIAVHARSVEQKYTGRADWGFLASVKREFGDRTILGSGDVTSPAEALRMLAETGVDGVLAARGAIGNPWFFAQARDLAEGRPARQPSLAEQREVIARHYRLACEAYDPRRGLKILRHFSLQYAKMHPRRTELRNALVPVRTEAEWLGVIDAFYGTEAPAAP